MAETEETKKEISKSLENPLVDATKKGDLSKAISDTPEKKQLLPNQISPGLDKFENKLAKIREKE
jgi:hypothetical protein